MATAKKLPSGSFRVRVFDYQDAEGKKHYKSFTGNSKKEAELQAARYKAGRIHSEDLLTVAKSIDEYIRLKTAVLSPSTVRGYKSMERELKASYGAFMARNVANISQRDLQGLVSDLAKDKKPKTVKNYITFICSACERFQDFKVTLPRIELFEVIVPTEEEIKRLFQTVKGTEIELPCMLGAYCMMRRGEICGLSMQDIDFKKKTIHIRHSRVLDVDGNWILKVPKTKKSNRVITVPDFVLDEIKKRGYITTYNPNVLTKDYEAALKRAGLPAFRFHDLRHYCASAFHFRGVPMSYTQKYGGWSTLDTLQRIYQHTLPDKEDDIYAGMAAYFAQTAK